MGSTTGSSSNGRVALTALFSVAFLATYASAAVCNQFTWSEGVMPYETPATRQYYALSRTEYCMSNETDVDLPSGRSCNATQCPLTTVPELYISSRSELNITLRNATYIMDIYALVKRSVPALADNPRYNFNSTVNLAPQQTYEDCIAEGTKQVWRYTPLLVCMEGVLNECSGEYSPPANGTPIRACGNVVESYKNPRVAYGAGMTALAQVNGTFEGPAPGNLTLSAASGLSVGGWAVPAVMAVALWELW